MWTEGASTTGSQSKPVHSPGRGRNINNESRKYGKDEMICTLKVQKLEDKLLPSITSTAISTADLAQNSFASGWSQLLNNAARLK